MPDAPSSAHTTQDAPKGQLWTRQFFVILLVSFLTHLPNMAMVQTLPEFLPTIGGDSATLGLMSTLFGLAALTMRPITGRWMDSYGRRTVLAFGFLIGAAVFFSFAWIDTLVIFLLLRTINGVGFSITSTTAPTVVSDISPRSRLAEGVSFFGLSTFAAIAVGPLVGDYILDHFGFAAVTRLAAVLSLMALLLLTQLNYEKKHQYARPNQAQPDTVPAAQPTVLPASEPAPSAAPKVPFRIADLVEKTAIRPSFIQFLIGLALAAIYTFIPNLGVALDIPSIGLFFTVFAVTVMLTTFFVGGLIVRHGYGRVFLPAAILMLASFVVLFLATNLLVVLAAAVLFGLGNGIVSPLLNVLVLQRCPPWRKGAANATLFAAIDLGIALGALIMGFIAEQAGIQIIYLVAAGFVLLAIVAFFTLLPRRMTLD
jgi:MFS family permease